MRLDVRAFGMAAGAVAAGLVLALTLLLVAAPGEDVASPVARAVLFGYTVSPAGAAVGALWAYAYGFSLGAVFAFAYNLAVAPSPPPELPEPEEDAAPRAGQGARGPDLESS